MQKYAIVEYKRQTHRYAVEFYKKPYYLDILFQLLGGRKQLH